MPVTPVRDGRVRTVVRRVRPQVDCGRFAAKRLAGEAVVVEADIAADGHDRLAAAVRYRRPGERAWLEVPMEPLGNDRWRGAFPVPEVGRYRYRVAAWVDHFGSWRHDIAAKVGAGQSVAADLPAGAELVARAARRARGDDGRALRAFAERLAGSEAGPGDALADELAELMARHGERPHVATSEPVLEVDVERERAGVGAWYELFPRSWSPTPGAYGTLADVADRLDYVAGMGFDVLYLPPIHPIGTTHRKGPDNALRARPGDPGSPWAIGGAAGGHTAVEPALGTPDDVDRLVARAAELGIEVALDLAFQCSGDHPWIAEHPDWFRRRPDGTIRFAENPPKRYEDIYPFDFETDDWRGLWEALAGVARFWIGHGIRIFRVDNPHTKPFRFWEWLIRTIRDEHPEVVFLSEAFTRPAVMYELAKLGFSQSYTYFAWRNAKWELTEYLRELTGTDVADFFRPSFWPNTPDILTAELQTGRRAAFVVRLILAATLSASYGIYGPAFELMEHEPREPGSEEYARSEKYEVRRWDLERADSLAPLIARVNAIRREHPALRANRNLVFHGVDNERLLAYSKRAGDGRDVVLVVVNLDTEWAQSGWTALDLPALGVGAGEGFRVHDLLAGSTYLWQGARNFVQLDPVASPAHVFEVLPGPRDDRAAGAAP